MYEAFPDFRALAPEALLLYHPQNDRNNRPRLAILEARYTEPPESTMTRTLSILASLLLLLTALTAAAAGQSVESALNHQFTGRILAVRHPIAKNSQVYDDTGKVLKGGDEGPWTLFGRFQVKRVRVEKDSVLFEGQRLLYVRSGSNLAPTRSKEKLKVEIKLTKPLSSADEANALLGHVFALTDVDVVQLAPRFWQNFLSDQLLHTTLNVSKEPAIPAGERAKRIKVVELQPDGTIKSGSTFVEMRDGVTRPRPKFTPEPEYTEAARSQRYQGTLVLNIVVDATGKVRAPNIVRPLGMGLDDAAVSTVLTWRFDPAKVDGEPVAVQMNVEVAFNLY
jgi:TonB family protein